MTPVTLILTSPPWHIGEEIVADITIGLGSVSTRVESLTQLLASTICTSCSPTPRPVKVKMLPEVLVGAWVSIVTV